MTARSDADLLAWLETNHPGPLRACRDSLYREMGAIDRMLGGPYSPYVLKYRLFRIEAANQELARIQRSTNSTVTANNKKHDTSHLDDEAKRLTDRRRACQRWLDAIIDNDAYLAWVRANFPYS